MNVSSMELAVLLNNFWHAQSKSKSLIPQNLIKMGKAIFGLRLVTIITWATTTPPPNFYPWKSALVGMC